MFWKYRHTVLVVCMLAFFVTFFARLTISPVVPYIIDDFDISRTQIGIGFAGMWLTYGITQYPSGVLADKYGERLIILVAVGGTAVSSLFLAIAPVFAVFLLCLVVLGGVAGLHYTVGTTLLSRTWDEMGFAVSIHSMGAPLAGLLAPVSAAWVGAKYGWRSAVALTILVGGPVFLLAWWRISATPPRKPNQSVVAQFQIRLLVDIVARKRIAFTLLIGIIGTFNLQALISFLPTFLVEYRAQSTALAGIVFSVYFVVRGVFQIVIGSMSDNFGRDFALAVCMILGAAGLLLFIFSQGPVFLGVGVLLLGIGASFFPALDPRFLDVIQQSEQGTEFGLVRTSYVVVGGFGPICTGLFADLLGWDWAFFALTGLYALAFVALTLNWALNLNL